jgi:hypothetical protein
MEKIVVLVIVLASLVACSPKRDADVQLGDGEPTNSELESESEPGASETESAAMQTGASIENVVFPKGAAAYPGSKVISFTNKMSDATDPEIVIFSNLETNVRLDDLVEFYRDKAKAVGFKVQLETRPNDGAMIASSNATETEKVTVLISKQEGTWHLIIGGNALPR